MTTKVQSTGSLPDDVQQSNGVACAMDAIAIDVSSVDTVFAPRLPRGLYIGGAGNIAITTALGTAITLAVVAGTILPIMCQGVSHTGTTATGIAALF